MPMSQKCEKAKAIFSHFNGRFLLNLLILDRGFCQWINADAPVNKAHQNNVTMSAFHLIHKFRCATRMEWNVMPELRLGQLVGVFR
jgi:hypothetical protein